MEILMTTRPLKHLAKSLKEFSDEELYKELKRRKRKRLGKVLGYRAVCYGDEYNYGGYTDYMIGDWNWNKQECYTGAKQCVETADNGGHVEPIYKSTLKPSRRTE
jgi:hypothetical protein